MSSDTGRAAAGSGVLVVGPSVDSEGGIAMVLRNYQRMPFWAQAGCRLYPSSVEGGSPVGRLVSQVWRALRFLPTAAGLRPAVVAIHTSSRRSFVRTMPYLVMARALGLPVILHVHPMSFVDAYREGGPILRAITRLALRSSRAVVVLTDEIRRGLQEIAPATRIVVIPNPVDTAEHQPASSPRVSAERPTVLYMGWIIRAKGVYDLVDAIPYVKDVVPDARFLFAGNKEVAKLTGLIAERRLGDTAYVLGWVTGDDRLKLLQTSDVLVLPSYSEGLPNVLLEAMASGLPVVTTPVGGIPSVVTDESTGILVPPGAPHQLAKAIVRVLSDNELRMRLSANARHRMETSYSLEAISGQLAKAYDIHPIARRSQ